MPNCNMPYNLPMLIDHVVSKGIPKEIAIDIVNSNIRSLKPLGIGLDSPDLITAINISIDLQIFNCNKLSRKYVSSTRLDFEIREFIRSRKKLNK